jgi:diphthamide biosynthesis protein 3
MSVADHDQSSGDQDIEQLVHQIYALLNSIINQGNSISATRNCIIDLADQIHAIHREILEVAVRILEQTMHGSVVRGIKARAEHLAAVAKGLDLKIRFVYHSILTRLADLPFRILAKSDPLLSNPELVSALQAYNEHLTSTAKDLRSQIEVVESELDRYEAKGKGMDQIANRYAELTTKCEKLRSEIQRLEK